VVTSVLYLHTVMLIVGTSAILKYYALTNNNVLTKGTIPLGLLVLKYITHSTFIKVMLNTILSSYWNYLDILKTIQKYNFHIRY